MGLMLKILPWGGFVRLTSIFTWRSAFCKKVANICATVRVVPLLRWKVRVAVTSDLDSTAALLAPIKMLMNPEVVALVSNATLAGGAAPVCDWVTLQALSQIRVA